MFAWRALTGSHRSQEKTCASAWPSCASAARAASLNAGGPHTKTCTAALGRGRALLSSSALSRPPDSFEQQCCTRSHAACRRARRSSSARKSTPARLVLNVRSSTSTPLCPPPSCARHRLVSSWSIGVTPVPPASIATARVVERTPTAHPPSGPRYSSFAPASSAPSGRERWPWAYGRTSSSNDVPACVGELSAASAAPGGSTNGV
mmetsp:Transcript_15052/g.46999  ORF Transcript_15052/g.46999 Transcript_15052/m.46999 type:complete len:206 (+) Transcript_15052:87-704(+)